MGGVRTSRIALKNLLSIDEDHIAFFAIYFQANRVWSSRDQVDELYDRERILNEFDLISRNGEPIVSWPKTSRSQNSRSTP